MKGHFTAAYAALICTSTLASVASAAPDVSGKVVLANLDRYTAVVRFGSTNKEIHAKKATVVAPKKYPLTFEVWSGNTKTGWKKQTIPGAGIYGFNFKSGQWVVAPLKKGTGTPPARPARRTTRPIVRPRRSPAVNADRRFWHPMARIVWASTELYRFIRDEQDRDLLREVIIRGREEDVKDIDRWLKEAEINAYYKAKIRDAFDELAQISDEDWKEIEGATDEDWDRARADLGGLVDAEAWKGVTEDLTTINTNEFWKDTQDVDLEAIDFADTEADVGDLGLVEDVDAGELDISGETYDLGGYDDFGDYGAQDFGDADLGGDFGDFGSDDFGDDF